MSIAIAIGMYAVWSSVFSIAKIVLGYSSPIFLTSFRMLFAAALLFAYLAITKRSSFKIKGRQFLSLVVLGFFSIYATNILEFWAVQYMSAAKTCFIYSLSPFFAALFSYLHFGEKMNPKKWLGLLLGLVGIIPVLTLQTGSEDLLNAVGFLSWPALAIMGAALCSVYGWVLLRIVVRDQMISPSMANGTSMLIGGIFALVHSLFAESWSPIPVTSGYLTPFLGWTLVMTLVFNILCYNLYGMMLKKFTATFLSFIGLLSPIFASLNGWLFLGEPLSWVIFLSTGIVSLGLWVVYSAELKQGYIVKKKDSLQAA